MSPPSNGVLLSQTSVPGEGGEGEGEGPGERKGGIGVGPADEGKESG